LGGDALELVSNEISAVKLRGDVGIERVGNMVLELAVEETLLACVEGDCDR
jgi:hypothetical protein